MISFFQIQISLFCGASFLRSINNLQTDSSYLDISLKIYITELISGQNDKKDVLPFRCIIVYHAMDNALLQIRRRVTKRKLVLAAVFAVILMVINKSPVFADDDTYTVKYVTYGSGVYIDDKTCGWDEADLGYTGSVHQFDGWINVEDEFAEKGENFQGWYTDESFKTEYTNQTYRELAGNDPSVKVVRLYAKLEHKHDGVSYKPWGIKNRMPDEGGNYYLLHNVVLDNYDRGDEAAWTVPGNVKICLNGHTITRKEKTDSNGVIPCSVISVPQGILLQIKDCKRGHDEADSIQGGDAEYGGGILVKGNLDLHDAVITGNKAESGGGIAVMNDASCSLTKCEIKGNSVNANGHGGGVYVADTAVLRPLTE